MIDESQLRLAGGYTLAIKSIDVAANRVYLELARDGEIVDSSAVSPSSDLSQVSDSTYYYPGEPDQNGPSTIMVHFSSAFSGAGANIATIDGIWQTSDDPLSLQEGDELDRMKVLEIGDTPLSITLVNNEDIRLSRNKDIPLMGDIRLKTADADTLRYCIHRPVTISPPGEEETTDN